MNGRSKPKRGANAHPSPPPGAHHDTIEELAAGVQAQGNEYLAITDRKLYPGCEGLKTPERRNMAKSACHRAYRAQPSFGSIETEIRH